MRSRFLLALAAALTAVGAMAQAPAAPSAAPDPAAAALLRAGAAPDEFVILRELKGVVLLPDATQVQAGRFAAQPGFDASRVPLIPADSAPPFVAGFIGQPVSQASLKRLTSALSLTLQQLGYPFVSVYLPPQDITAGWVQVVVQISVAAESRVEGAKYFSSAHYLAALRQQPGQPIDVTALGADLDWLNRNPFRQVTVVTEPGPRPGTTAIKLRVTERFPLRATFGYNNTGSRVSDENRVQAGLSWGNAFGRGDLLDYQYSASPDGRTSVTHSVNYATSLPSRHTVRFSAAYSELIGRVNAPLELGGSNKQASLRYELPLRAPAAGFAASLSAGVDFKASDNNLLFATFPITDNLTHIVQFAARYGINWGDARVRSSAGVTVVASPGGLTRRNRTTPFNLSRAGASPEYAYVQLDGSHQRSLPHGFLWSLRGQAQWASGNLLGSEQLSGGGSGSVRGYEEGEAFGDSGVLLSQELALPARSVATWLGVKRWTDSAQVFLFQDAALLRSAERLPGERDWTDLHSLGVGLRHQLGRHVSLQLTQGWQLRASGVSRSGDRARTHVSVQASF